MKMSLNCISFSLTEISTVEMCITCYSVMEKSVHRTWKS